ncbi:MAG TPA: hypothetical protein VMS17_06080 [Gemmataceae bacterium]|nr:hypothetical protein [Gemmataceae bacterium]
MKLKRIEDSPASKSLGPKEADGLMVIEPQPKDMDVTVTATTDPAMPVTLYLVEVGDANSKPADDQQNQFNAQDDITAGRDPKSLVKKSDASDSPSLQATAPANKRYVVIAANSGTKKTDVKDIKVLGKW